MLGASTSLVKRTDVVDGLPSLALAGNVFQLLLVFNGPLLLSHKTLDFRYSKDFIIKALGKDRQLHLEASRVELYEDEEET